MDYYLIEQIKIYNIIINPTNESNDENTYDNGKNNH